MSLDKALSRVGEFGRYQMILLAMLWLVRMPLLLPVLLTYFAAYNPAWRCIGNSPGCPSNGTAFSAGTTGYTARCSMKRSEWEFTRPESFSIVTQFDLYCDNEILVYVAASIFFFAWAIGAVPLGWLADRFGRKSVSFPCLFIAMVSTVIGAFSPNVWMYIVFRFLTGFFTPGAFVSFYVIGSEFVGPGYRPMVSTFFSVGFTSNFVILGFKAYFIRDWKTLSLVCTLPYIFVFLFYRYIPESFRWLRVKGKTDECVAVLNQIARINRRQNTILSDDDLFEDPVKQHEDHRVSFLAVFWPLRILTRTVVQMVAWFVAGLVFYGVTLAADNLGGEMYRDYIVSSLVTYPAAFLSCYLCKRHGRKFGVVPSLLFTAFVLTAVSLIPEKQGLSAARSFLGMSGKLSIGVCYSSLYVWSIELNPTVTRSLAMGLLQFVTRIGATAAPWVAKGLRQYSTSSPFVVMAAVSVVAGLLCYWLPETRLASTAEVTGDVGDVNTNDINEDVEMTQRDSSARLMEK